MLCLKYCCRDKYLHQIILHLSETPQTDTLQFTLYCLHFSVYILLFTLLLSIHYCLHFYCPKTVYIFTVQKLFTFLLSKTVYIFTVYILLFFLSVFTFLCPYVTYKIYYCYTQAACINNKQV